MENRLPFSKYLTAMLSFPIVGFGHVFKTMFVPILFICIMAIAIMGYPLYKLIMDLFIHGEYYIEDNIEQYISTFIMLFVGYFVVLIAGALIYSSAMAKLIRFLLYDEQIEGWFNIGITGDGLRIFTLGFAQAFAAFLIIMPVLILGAILALANEALGGLFMVIGFIVTFCYLAVKFTPMQAGTIATKSIYFTDSWNITRGYFWSIFWGIFLVVMLYGIAQGILSQFFEFPLTLMLTDVMIDVEDFADITWQVFMPTIILGVAYLIFNFIVSIFSAGYYASMTAVTYRALTTDDEWV